MKNTPRKIAIFYHVARIGSFWQNIDREIMHSLKSSGLLERADYFIRNETNGDSYEFPTIDMLDAFATTYDVDILYIHTKGASRNSKSIDDWRACMLYWLVDHWRDCVEKLERFDAVGINHMETPSKHFQGNFWWSKSSHIRKLGTVRSAEFTPNKEDQTERHKAEFWLLSQPGVCYSPYHHNLDPYQTENPKSRYDKIPFNK